MASFAVSAAPQFWKKPLAIFDASSNKPQTEIREHRRTLRYRHLLVQQMVLVEAAKLVPMRNPDLALVYENARQKGNANCATLAVTRKLFAYLMAVDREQRDFEAVRE